jgi:hypothetical protein
MCWPRQDIASQITLPLTENQPAKPSGGRGIIGTRHRVIYLLQPRDPLLGITESIDDEGGGSLSTHRPPSPLAMSSLPLPLPRLAKSKVTSHAHTARGLWQWPCIYRWELEGKERHVKKIHLHFSVCASERWTAKMWNDADRLKQTHQPPVKNETVD